MLLNKLLNLVLQQLLFGLLTRVLLLLLLGDDLKIDQKPTLILLLLLLALVAGCRLLKVGQDLLLGDLKAGLRGVINSLTSSSLTIP